MTRTWTLRIALGLLLVAGLVPFLHKGMDGTSEFPVYTLGGDRMLVGSEIYRESDPKPFTYPPFFAVPFMLAPPVSMDPPRSAAPFVAWYAVNAVTLVAILVALQRLLVTTSARSETGTWLFWLVTLVLAGRYIGSVFGNQSHDLLVFLPIVAALVAITRQRDATAGSLIGLAAAFKATPLLFVVPLLLQRRWRALAAMLAAVVVLTFTPDLLFPRTDGGTWVGAWLTTFVLRLDPGGPADAGPWFAESMLNQSLGGTVHRLLFLTDSADASRYVVPVFQLAVLAVVAFAVRRPPTATIRAMAQFSAVVCGMVLLSPMSSKAHFCVLLLPVAVTTHVAVTTRARYAIAALLAVFVIGTLTSKDLVGRELGNRLLTWGTVTWLTVCLLAVSTWIATRGGLPLQPGNLARDENGESAT